MKKIVVALFLFCFIMSHSQNRTLDGAVIIKITKEDTNKVLYLNKTSLSLIKSGNYDSALYYGNEALKLAIKLNPSYQKGVSSAYYNLGIINNAKLNYDIALDYFIKALKIDEALKNKQGIASNFGRIGSVYQYKGNYSKALEYYFKALKIDEEIGDKKNTATHLEYIGVTFGDQSNHTKALEYFFKALKINEDLQYKKGVAFNLNNIGLVYYNLMNDEKALEYFLKTLAIAEELEIKQMQVSSLGNIGSIYEGQANYQKALKYYLKVLEIEKEIDDIDNIMQTLTDIGSLYTSQKEYKNAFNALYQALAISDSLKSPNDMKEIYNKLSRLYETTTIPLPDTIGGIILNTEGMRLRALLYTRRYISINDSLFSLEKNEQAFALKIKYETDKKESENKVLSQQNQIQSLQLNQNKFFIIGLGALLFLVLIVAYLLFRQNKLRNQQREMQLEQKLLRSQMNPHFIFNSLQAIQNYILKNEQKDAVKYLSSFASITRAVLENSRMELISVKKEVALLDNYLQLQKLRFGARFDYKIHVDELIDAENTLIPPMLSQPFIENALEHGMKDMESGGLIDVFIALKDNSLLLEIKDNGKGISVDATPQKNHQSLATSITKERIALMNKQKIAKIIFSVTDAYPNQLQKGVKVSFSIPMQHLSS